jgi:hypothetical protein
MRASTKVLLGGLIDYAGTFAPASRTLPDALSLYAAARRSAHSWIVGRLVLPAGSLDEFERLVPNIVSSDIAPFNLSVILGGDPAAQATQLDAIVAFNDRVGRDAAVVSVEFPPLPASVIPQLMHRVSRTLEPFFEVPADADLERRIGAIATVGGSAKVRTGGVTASAFPGPEDLARLILTCADAGIRFKATAGLHHAFRGCYALTYEASSPDSPMYGFLNMCLAAALARTGAVLEEMTEALEESSTDAFQFREDGLVWKQRTIPLRDLSETRAQLFRSFGSCAISEPIDELTQLHLL